MLYEIQIKDRNGNWSADCLGANNLYDLEEEAQERIDTLRALSSEWAYNPNEAEIEYRVIRLPCSVWRSGLGCR